MSEDEFLREILSLCHQYGHLVHHCFDSRKCTGSGLPDLVIVGKRGIVFAELKAPYGKRTSSQVSWAYAIIGASGRYCSWEPKDLDHAEAILREL